MTLLHVAAHSQQPHVARFLIHYQAAHLETDSIGRTALHYFCLSNAVLQEPLQNHGSASNYMNASSLQSPGSPVEFQAVQWSQMSAGITHQQAIGRGSLNRSNLAVWLGEVEAQGQNGNMQPDDSGALQRRGVCDYLLCMQALVLLEDALGLAPIDSCGACGMRYRVGLGMLSDEGGGDADRVVKRADVHADGLESGWQRGTVSTSGSSCCTCGGILFRCAVEQSLKVCALLVPDALRTSGGGVLGIPCCTQKRSVGTGEPVVLFSDLPKEVRVMICQRSCVASGLMK